jgi:indolepyruvate ferredoxin oxidoreductase beta subunit
MNPPYNILVAGVGGQGVITLTRAITSLVENSGKNSISSIFKGGAQRLGTVHSVIRIFNDQHDFKHFSPQIPNGKLHLLLALEPWEAVRHSALFSRTTKLVVNSVKKNLLVERLGKTTVEDPMEVLRRFELSPVIKDFETLSQKKHGSKKMTNFELGLEAIKQGFLPFTENNYQTIFHQSVLKKDQQ